MYRKVKLKNDCVLKIPQSTKRYRNVVAITNGSFFRMHNDILQKLQNEKPIKYSDKVKCLVDYLRQHFARHQGIPILKRMFDEALLETQDFCHTTIVQNCFFATFYGKSNRTMKRNWRCFWKKYDEYSKGVCHGKV